MNAREQKSTFMVRRPRSTACVGLGLVWLSPAYAQLSKVTSLLTTIATWMQSLGVAIVTIAVVWAGVKVIFGHQQIRDLGNLFWGATLIGGASLFAGFFLSGQAS
jgi:type IV secretion system protein VirB2